MTSLPDCVRPVCIGWLGLLLAGHGVCAQTPATTPDSSAPSLSALLSKYGYQSVTLTPYSEDGLYTVQVDLDTVPTTLLFDSGYNETVTFHDDQAAMLGIARSAARTVAGAQGTSTVTTVQLPSLTVNGTLHFGPQTASIGRFPMADGALGARFISAHNAIVDYSQNILYLQDQLVSALPSAALTQSALERPGDIAIPLQRVIHGSRAVYLVQAVVASKALTLLLDTGWGTNSDGTVLDARRAAALGLGGKSQVRLKVGALTLDRVPLYTVDLSQVEQKYRKTGFPAIDGVFGAALLKAHDARIDFAHAMMYLRGE